MNKCKPKQFADTTRCLSCGLTWDTNDINPPKCRSEIIREIRLAPIGVAVNTTSRSDELLEAWGHPDMGTFTRGKGISLYCGLGLNKGLDTYTIHEEEAPPGTEWILAPMPGVTFYLAWACLAVVVLGSALAVFHA